MEILNHKKKEKNQNPDGKFRHDLDLCSKRKDLSGAMSLYDFALSNKIRLNHYHFNAFLYICSEVLADPLKKTSASEFGFRIFDYMNLNEVKPTEATITAMARLAAAKEDGDLAFELVKNMEKYGLLPRLRSYNPALICLCRNLDAGKAYEVEKHMALKGVDMEEPEIAALLRVSAELERGEKVYEYLHKMREKVRCVSESTAEIILNWFGGEAAGGLGVENWDAGRVKNAVSTNGGGWHGLGWLGKGKWIVSRARVDANGVCLCCGEQLSCVDINKAETEKFALSVASLAMERELQSNFSDFQDWLDKCADYKAIVDGANIGLYQQNFAEGGFSLSQLEAVVEELYHMNARPLVILHNKRIRALLENASNRELLERWIADGVLYGTPYGSNDDWYWLYGAIKLKCLIVTNDEMRDHIFELLGSSFFLKWKERHQVRYTLIKGDLKFQMPPAYSLVIQESEKGTWHVPLLAESSDESSRSWVCITRQNWEASSGVLATEDVSETGQLQNDLKSLKPCERQCISGGDGSHVNPGASHISDMKPMPLTGKRKGRPSSLFES